MKKIFTLGSMLFLLAASASAQTFAFYKGDAPLANNVEFTVSQLTEDEFGSMVIESGLSLKNLTNVAVEARAIQMIVIAPPSEEYGILNFCFERCQEGNANRSQTRSIGSNELMSPPEFHLCFYPFGENYTVATVKYEVFPVNDPEDRISVTVTYDYNENSVGLNTIGSANKIQAFREGNNVKFNYSFDSDNLQLEVYSVIGNKIAQHRLNSNGTFTLPEALTQGIYIYTVKSNNKVLTAQKLIIQ